MYERDFVKTLATRLAEPRRFLQIVEGPRQTGKSTAVSQALAYSNAPRVEFSFDRPRDRRSKKAKTMTLIGCRCKGRDTKAEHY